MGRHTAGIKKPKRPRSRSISKKPKRPRSRSISKKQQRKSQTSSSSSDQNATSNYPLHQNSSSLFSPLKNNPYASDVPQWNTKPVLGTDSGHATCPNHTSEIVPHNLQELERQNNQCLQTVNQTYINDTLPFHGPLQDKVNKSGRKLVSTSSFGYPGPSSQNLASSHKLSAHGSSSRKTKQLSHYFLDINTKSSNTMPKSANICVPTHSTEKKTNESNQSNLPTLMNDQLPDCYFQNAMPYIRNSFDSNLQLPRVSKPIETKLLNKTKKPLQLAQNSSTSTSIKQNKTNELNESNSLRIDLRNGIFSGGSTRPDLDGVNRAASNSYEQVSYLQQMQVNCENFTEKYDKTTLSEDKMNKICQSSYATADSINEISMENSSSDLSEYLHHGISVSQSPDGSFVIKNNPDFNTDKRSTLDKTMDILFSDPNDKNAEPSRRLYTKGGTLKGLKSNTASDKDKSIANSATSPFLKTDCRMSSFCKTRDLNSSTVTDSAQKSGGKSRISSFFPINNPASKFCVPREINCNDILHDKSIYRANSTIASSTTEKDCTSPFYAPHGFNSTASNVTGRSSSAVSPHAATYDSTKRSIFFPSSNLNNSALPDTGLTPLATPPISPTAVMDHTNSDLALLDCMKRLLSPNSLSDSDLPDILSTLSISSTATEDHTATFYAQRGLNNTISDVTEISSSTVSPFALPDTGLAQSDTLPISPTTLMDIDLDLNFIDSMERFFATNSLNNFPDILSTLSISSTTMEDHSAIFYAPHDLNYTSQWPN